MYHPGRPLLSQVPFVISSKARGLQDPGCPCHPGRPLLSRTPLFIPGAPVIPGTLVIPGAPVILGEMRDLQDSGHPQI